MSALSRANVVIKGNNQTRGLVTFSIRVSPSLVLQRYTLKKQDLQLPRFGLTELRVDIPSLIRKESFIETNAQHPAAYPRPS